jgi:hypothetical protein
MFGRRVRACIVGQLQEPLRHIQAEHLSFRGLMPLCRLSVLQGWHCCDAVPGASSHFGMAPDQHPNRPAQLQTQLEQGGQAVDRCSTSHRCCTVLPSLLLTALPALGLFCILPLPFLL